MVAKNARTEDFAADADVTVAPDDWQWETVADGAPTGVIFENIGESFVGQYTGTSHVEREPAADGTDQSFDLFIFLGRDGDKYSLNHSYTLVEAMSKVEVGNWVRVTYLKDVKVAKWPTPMKDFRVDVRK